MGKAAYAGRTFVPPLSLDQFRANPVLTPRVTLANGTVIASIRTRAMTSTMSPGWCRSVTTGPTMS